MTSGAIPNSTLQESLEFALEMSKVNEDFLAGLNPQDLEKFHYWRKEIFDIIKYELGTSRPLTKGQHEILNQIDSEPAELLRQYYDLIAETARSRIKAGETAKLSDERILESLIHAKIAATVAATGIDPNGHSVSPEIRTLSAQSSDGWIDYLQFEFSTSRPITADQRSILMSINTPRSDLLRQRCDAIDLLIDSRTTGRDIPDPPDPPEVPVFVGTRIGQSKDSASADLGGPGGGGPGGDDPSNPLGSRQLEQYVVQQVQLGR